MKKKKHLLKKLTLMMDLKKILQKLNNKMTLKHHRMKKPMLICQEITTP